MRRLAAVLLGLALLALCACRLPGSSSGCTNIQIDWVDFVQVGTTQFVAGMDPPVTVTQDQLGAVVAHVKFRVDGNVCDPSYRPKDGDAAFLDPGTPVYAVSGFPTTELLAAKRDGQIVAFRAFRPKA